jgi:hypothetical protein
VLLELNQEVGIESYPESYDAKKDEYERPRSSKGCHEISGFLTDGVLFFMFFPNILADVFPAGDVAYDMLLL